jgi:hypothetical protein
MRQKTFARRIAGWKVVVGLAVAAAGIGTGCTTAEVNALLAGVQVASTQLVDNQNNNISFGDWLASELND